MKNIIAKKIVTGGIVLSVFIFGANVAFGAILWASPEKSPDVGNSRGPLNDGNDLQSIGDSLEAAGFFRAYSASRFYGKTGVGAEPEKTTGGAKLKVSGDIRIHSVSGLYNALVFGPNTGDGDNYFGFSDNRLPSDFVPNSATVSNPCDADDDLPNVPASDPSSNPARYVCPEGVTRECVDIAKGSYKIGDTWKTAYYAQNVHCSNLGSNFSMANIGGVFTFLNNALKGTLFMKQDGSVDIGIFTAAQNAQKGQLNVAGKIKITGSKNGVRFSDGLQTQSDAVPDGAVMFFNGNNCPVGWHELENARGRYVVAIGEGADAGGAKNYGAMVGIPLSDQENRPAGLHTHAVSDPGHSHLDSQKGVYGESTNNNDDPVDVIDCGYGGCPMNTNSNVTGLKVENPQSIAGPGSYNKAGTPAPYVQYFLCQKGDKSKVRWEGLDHVYGKPSEIISPINNLPSNDTCGINGNDDKFLKTDLDNGKYTCPDNLTSEMNCVDHYDMEYYNTTILSTNYKGMRRDIKCLANFVSNDTASLWSDVPGATPQPASPASSEDTCNPGDVVNSYSCPGGTTTRDHCVDIKKVSQTQYDSAVLSCNAYSTATVLGDDYNNSPLSNYGNWSANITTPCETLSSSSVPTDTVDGNASDAYTCQPGIIKTNKFDVDIISTSSTGCWGSQTKKTYRTRKVTCAGNYTDWTAATTACGASAPSASSDTANGNVYSEYLCQPGIIKNNATDIADVTSVSCGLFSGNKYTYKTRNVTCRRPVYSVYYEYTPYVPPTSTDSCDNNIQQEYNCGMYENNSQCIDVKFDAGVGMFKQRTLTCKGPRLCPLNNSGQPDCSL